MEKGSICTVTIEGQDRSFNCGDSVILDAAIAEGVSLPYNCRGGACGTCKAQVIEGAVEHGWMIGLGISDEEIREGRCLLCSCKPKSERLVLRMLKQLEVLGAPIKPGTFDSEVLAVRRLSPVVVNITLLVDAASEFRFEAGMHVYVTPLGVAASRPYSIATSPVPGGAAPDGMIDLLIARHEHGVVSRALCDRVCAGDILRVSGPFGTFGAPPANQGSVLMLAGGTGVAPLMSIAAALLGIGHKEKVLFALCARTPMDVVMLDCLKRLTIRYPNLCVEVYVSRSAGREIPQKWRAGRITEHLGHDPKLRGFDRLLIAGPPEYVSACARHAVEVGVDSNHIFTEAFDNTVGKRPAFLPGGPGC
jgi:ferredoxin-NADP reductase/ferredoxin